MRTLILSIMSLLLSTAALAQQGSKVTGSEVVVFDTVHYYFNKFYFKTGKGIPDLPFYSTPFATSTLVSHMGSKFSNSETVVISGIEAFVARDSGSTKPSIPVHLYLCTVQNGLPVMPPLDSVIFSISGDKKLRVMGGNFVSGLSYTLSSDFAVLMRNMSPWAGDSVLLGHTGSKTATNTAAAANEKHGEGNGYVRIAGQFYHTTNSLTRGFGMGTDYEFCIAPMVQYTLTSDHVVAANADSVCTQEPMVFTSLTSQRFLQPQFNLVEFARRWSGNPDFAPATLKIKMKTGPNPGDTLWQDVFPQDSAVGWYFAPEDNLQNSPHPRVFLPANTANNQITFSTDSALTKMSGGDSLTCFVTNEFRTRFKSMAIYGRGSYHAYNDPFTICTSFCGKDGVGLTEGNRREPVKVFPNPSTGKFFLSTSGPDVKIKVFTIQGVLISEIRPGTDGSVDISRYADGVYMLQLGESRPVKLVKQH